MHIFFRSFPLYFLSSFFSPFCCTLFVGFHVLLSCWHCCRTTSPCRRFLSRSSWCYLCAITLYISQLNISLFCIHYYVYVMSIQWSSWVSCVLWGRIGSTREYALAGISSELSSIASSLQRAFSSAMPKRARIHYASLRSSLVNLPISIYGPLVERNVVSEVRSRNQKRH